MNRLTKEQQRIVGSHGFGDKIYLFAGYWKVADCNKAPNALFLFGDNDVSQGTGGQAVIRYCPNAMGIPTKKYPDYKQSSYYTDAEYEQNCENISNAINGIIDRSVDYKEIIFPYDGFGTGLANLPERAPKTFKFLETMIDECFGVAYPLIRERGPAHAMDPRNTRKLKNKNIFKNP
jgi:hypothetical protein